MRIAAIEKFPFRSWNAWQKCELWTLLFDFLMQPAQFGVCVTQLFTEPLIFALCNNDTSVCRRFRHSGQTFRLGFL